MQASPKQTTLERFEKFFDKTEGCWIWKGQLFNRGHGVFKLNGSSKVASRVAFDLYKGPIIPNLIVRHTCDNRTCVNPEHLIQGTYQDNMDDCVARGRTAKGSSHGMAVITEDLAKIIKLRLAQGKVNQTKLAKELGVNRKIIVNIKHNLTWKHI